MIYFLVWIFLESWPPFERTFVEIPSALFLPNLGLLSRTEQCFLYCHCLEYLKIQYIIYIWLCSQNEWSCAPIILAISIQNNILYIPSPSTQFWMSPLSDIKTCRMIPESNKSKSVNKCTNLTSIRGSIRPKMENVHFAGCLFTYLTNSLNPCFHSSVKVLLRP